MIQHVIAMFARMEHDCEADAALAWLPWLRLCVESAAIAAMSLKH